MLSCLSNAKSKVKGFLKRNKVAVTVSAVSSAMSVFAVNAFAAGEVTKPDVTSTLTSGFQTCVNDLIGYAVAIVPIALSAFGFCWAIRKCMDFFSSATKKT